MERGPGGDGYKLTAIEILGIQGDWHVGSLARMFMDLEGVPMLPATREDEELYNQRFLNAIPRAAVAVNAVIRGLTVNEYLRNMIQMELRSQESPKSFSSEG